LAETARLQFQTALLQSIMLAWLILHYCCCIARVQTLLSCTFH